MIQSLNFLSKNIFSEKTGKFRGKIPEKNHKKFPEIPKSAKK
jgi:hypothetical protein